MPAPLDATELVDRLVLGQRRAVAEALSRLERSTRDVGALLARLRPHLGHALVVGITGPPGAGKSTLVNAFIAEVRSTGRRVAILAIDPSSPLTGGAILGDRIRMTAAHDDDGVLVRSLGSRGAVGGLTPAAVRMIDALDAARFDLVLLETVGTGQSEVDVAQVADIVLVVSAPGLGDGIQAMKAGLLEIADVVVVNKADREGAERTADELTAALALRAAPGDVSVIKTTAITGAGIPDLLGHVLEKGAARMAEGLVLRRRRRARYLIAGAAADLLARRVRESDATTNALADAVLAGEVAPIEAAARLLGMPELCPTQASKDTEPTPSPAEGTPVAAAAPEVQARE